MDSESGVSVEAIDFVVRSLARDAAIEMDELAGAEPSLMSALSEIDPSMAALTRAEIIAAASRELADFESAMRTSPDVDQRERYYTAVSKVGAGRQYDATGGILTAAAAVLVIIIALRLGRIDVDPQKGVRVIFLPNGEPLSSPIRQVTDLVGALLKPLAGPRPGTGGSQDADASATDPEQK